MADDSPWEHFQNLGLDPAAVRWAVAFIVGWFVAWTGFVLYSGTSSFQRSCKEQLSRLVSERLPISQTHSLS